MTAVPRGVKRSGAQKNGSAKRTPAVSLFETTSAGLYCATEDRLLHLVISVKAIKRHMNKRDSSEHL